MRGEEIAAMVVMTSIVGGIVAMWSVYYTKKEAAAKARIDVIKKALEHPTVDERTKGDLLRLLAEEHRRSQLPFLHRFGGITNIARVLVMGVGWVLFVFCGSVLALSWMGAWPYYGVHEHTAFAVVGFVLMTLPAALRELTRRSRPATEPER